MKRKTSKKAYQQAVQKTNDQVEKAISGLIGLFESGQVPKAIAMATNPVIKIPSNKWSLRNKLIMFCNGTGDARGFRQWLEVSRNVSEGKKAMYILAPRFRKVPDKDANGNVKVDANGKPLEIQKLIGFRGQAVFKVEDTEGETLDYEKLEVPNFKFRDVAESWGLKVVAVSGGEGYYGAYSSQSQEILMASPDEEVFYHELAHAGHDRVGLLKKRTIKQKEIVAEFVSCVLAYIQGKQTKIGNTYEYLKRYAGEEEKVESCVLTLIGDIEKVINEIMTAEKSLNSPVVATQ
jgi:hypothetical protein